MLKLVNLSSVSLLHSRGIPQYQLPIHEFSVFRLEFYLLCQILMTLFFTARIFNAKFLESHIPVSFSFITSLYGFHVSFSLSGP